MYDGTSHAFQNNICFAYLPYDGVGNKSVNPHPEEWVQATTDGSGNWHIPLDGVVGGTGQPGAIEYGVPYGPPPISAQIFDPVTGTNQVVNNVTLDGNWDAGDPNAVADNNSHWGVSANSTPPTPAFILASDNPGGVPPTEPVTNTGSTPSDYIPVQPGQDPHAVLNAYYDSNPKARDICYAFVGNAWAQVTTNAQGQWFIPDGLAPGVPTIGTPLGFEVVDPVIGTDSKQTVTTN